MTVMFGPWADLALLLRQTVAQKDGEAGSFLPLWFFGLLLFLPVCLLLLQLIIYFSWKLRQGRHVINFSCLVHVQTTCYVIFTTALCVTKWKLGVMYFSSITSNIDLLLLALHTI